MRTKPEPFFSEAQRESITRAVKDVESRTVGEIAVMLVQSSGHYHVADVLGGLTAGGVAALAAWILRQPPPTWPIVLAAVAFFAVGIRCLRASPALKRLFLNGHDLDKAVATRAEAAFLEKGLHKTRERTGVLFFISLFERRVRVLADTGIYARIGQETLDGYAATVAEGIRQGRASEALCRAIAESGEELSKHFPLKPGDVNELPDEIII